MATPMLLDDSSDDEVEVETSLEDQEAIMKIEGMLQANPMQIKVHLKYISLLRKCQLTQRLRSARMTLRDLYPLTLAMWQDWLADETSALQNKLAAASAGDDVDQDELDEDRDLTLQLFEAATSEYLSVDMWLSYLQFVMSLNTASADNAEDTVTRVRDVGEKALTAAGLHLSQASRLWDAYRAYEQALADAGWGGPGQVEKVRSLFQRQLKIPLLGMENTMQAYMHWEQAQGTSDTVTSGVQREYDAAVALMEIRMPLEEMLSAQGAGEDVLATAYKAYLKTEEATRDPARITYMYERALASLPKKEQLWIRYTNYVEEILKVKTVVKSVSQRAARNCHSSGTMWARYLSAVERLSGSDSDLDKIYETAFTYKLKTEEGHLAIILARCDSLRRRGTDGMARLRAVVKEGTEKLLKFNPEHCDPELRLAGYLAHCEMEVANDVKGARDAWEGALKASTGRLASTWQAYIAWERSHRYISEARALYRRCYTRKLEDKGEIQICRDWLRFEREEGSPEDYFVARLKLEPLLEDATPAPHKTLTSEEVARMRQAKDPNYKGLALQPYKREEEEPRSKRPRVEPIPGRPVSKGSTYGSEFVAFVNHLPKFTKLVGLTKFFDCCPGLKDIRMPLDHMTGKPRGLAYIEFEGPEGVEAALALNGNHLDGVPLTIKRSDRQSGNPADNVEHVAFCRNLAWATSENSLRSFFSSCQGLKDIRLPVDHNTGRVRGIAYVEFEDRQGLENALSLNGSFIDGRPVAIEESAPKNSLTPGGRGGRGGRGRGGFFGGRGGDGGGRGRGFFPSPGGGRDGGYSGGRGYYGGGPSPGGYGAGGGGFDGPMSNDQFRQQMFM